MPLITAVARIIVHIPPSFPMRPHWKQFRIFTQGIHDADHICIGDLYDKLVRSMRAENNTKHTHF